MKRFNVARLLSFTFLVTFIIFGVASQPQVSSGASSGMPEELLGNHTTFLPLVIGGNVTPIIPDTTNILSEDTTDHLTSISQDGGTFTFAESTPELEALAAGEIMVSEISDVAPNGFLRKVTNITTSNGQTIVTTQPATLEDAIQQGSLHVTQQLTPADVATSLNLAGVSLQANTMATLEDTFFINVDDVVLYDNDGNPGTTNDQIKANGTIEIAPDFDFTVEIRDWELKNLSMFNTTTETAELEFVTEVEFNLIKEEKEIARYYFSPITVFVGFVPIVFQPVLTVNVGIDGDIHVGVTTSVTQEATLNAGLTYDDNKWTPASDFSNSFTYNPPTLSAGLDMKGYAGAQVTLLLYGVTGPYVEVNTYLKLEADVLATPWWKLFGGLEVPAGVKIEIFSHTVAGYETVLIDYKFPIAQADNNTNNPPFTPANPDPPTSGHVPPGDVVLSWSGGDPDGDSVEYDLYTAALPCNLPCSTPPPIESFSLTASGLTDTTYNDGYASFDWYQFWYIVAKDEHGLERMGPIWSFYGDPCLDPDGNYCG